MPHKETEVIRWSIRCQDYSHVTLSYALAGDTYGHLLGRTIHNELVEFNSWQDPVFDEVSNLVQVLMGKELGTSDCFRRVLGNACDPSPSGEQYDFTGKIWCPVCGSSNVKYGPDDPPQFSVIELPLATHRAWNELGNQVKKELMQAELRKVRCLPALKVG